MKVDIASKEVQSVIRCQHRILNFKIKEILHLKKIQDMKHMINTNNKNLILLLQIETKKTR